MTEPRRKVLVVDDELDALEAHLGDLADAGYDVTTYKSTDEAIKSFLAGEATQFDVIVLDMMIPPPVENPEPIDIWDGLRSGGHLLEILRRHTPEPVPVLLLSNLAEDEIQLEAWDRFEEWQHEHGREVPEARSTDEVRDVLRRHFRTWIRAKRRTPPWHFPKVLGGILDEVLAYSA
jgi:CheY-like chemotaxis protein